MRVHVLSRRRYRAHCFVYPLRAFSRQLRRRGIETKIFFRHDDERLTRCDVLAVVGDYWDTASLLRRPEATVEVLEDLRKRVPVLMWCDATDDNGHLFEPAFAKVDLYAKKQILKERELYGYDYRERGYHSEYYYRNFGEEVARIPPAHEIPVQRALEPWEIEKLALAWNVGLGDYNTLLGHGRTLLPYKPYARFAGPVRDALDTRRPLGVSCRGTTRYPLPAITFHRSEVSRLVSELADRTEHRIESRGRVSPREYLKELAQTRICVSPFGFGEICWRDFEGMLCGALLVKPDMDHLETWPEYFEKDVTYAAHRWDFEDLQRSLLELLEDPERCRRMAKTAQDRYLASLSQEGGEAFTEHFSALLERAWERSERRP